MDITKGCEESCNSPADDEPRSEKTSIEQQENRSSHATFNQKETLELDDNDHLSRHEKDPEVLESVQKYAKRIKSFLGWEPAGGELDDLKSEGRDESDATKLRCDSHQRTGNNHEEENLLNIEVRGENNQPYFEDTKEDTKLEPKLEDLETNLKSKDKVANIFPTPENKSTDYILELHEAKGMDQNLDLPEIISFDTNNLENRCDEIDEDHEGKFKEPPDLKKTGLPSELENNITSSQLNYSIISSTPENLVSSESVDRSDSSLGVENSHTETLLCDKENTVLSGENKEQISDLKETVLEEKLGYEDEPTLSEKISEENQTDYAKNESVEPFQNNQTEIKENGISINLKEINKSEKEREDENILLKTNIRKPYMDEIRRLSLDIVKDVIESARNSVHEMFAAENLQKTFTENESQNNDNGELKYATNDTQTTNSERIENKLETMYLSIPKIDSITKKSHDLEKLNTSENFSTNLQSRKASFVDEETICGFGRFKPSWIQKFATPKAFLLLFSIVGIINGTYYTYVVSIISTLEKRYAFKTKVSGIILLADEITPLVLGVPVGYVGGKTHRPRMVALGMFMSAACCFVSLLPYLIYGSAKHLAVLSKNETGPEVCENEPRFEACDSDDRPPTLTVVGIFLIASFLKGFATLSYYIIGFSYMDDIIKKKNSAVYFAVALALRLLGPLVGFLMSSAFLKIYENPFDDPGFGPDDPRWIGAWWMGFFLQGVLLVIFTLPIALFPRRLPGQKKVEKSPQTADKENLKETLAGLWSALKRLGKNPIFILLIVNTTMKIFGHFGHAIMLPKYMENQFRLSAADASLFSGATSILCVMLSTVFGGFLIWKFRPRIKLLLAGMVTSELILSIGFLTLMIPRCQPAEMLHFGVNDVGLILDSPCNQNCDCSTTSFTPFCGPDGKTTYFSPCYAGCTQDLSTLISSENQTIFGNCSCVNAPNSSDVVSATITEGFCPDENCWSKAVAYLIILFTLLTISSSLTVAHTMILLRSVHPSDKSVALGTFETFICLFGFIPFPVTFGALVDSACLVWEESCGETGNCWFYDMDKYGYLLHGAASLFCFLSTICLTCLYFLSSRVRNLYVDDDEEEEHIDSIKLDTVSGSVTKL